LALGRLRPHWPQLDEGLPDAAPRQRSRGLLVLALASILIWAPVLPFTQPEQINRRRAERLLEGGQVAAGLAELSAHTPADYPPHWEPPPRLGFRDPKPGTDAIVAAMQAEWPAPWVADVYLRKVERGMQDGLMPYWPSATWKEMAERLALEREGPPGAAERLGQIQFLLDHAEWLSEEDVEALRALRALGEGHLARQRPPPG